MPAVWEEQLDEIDTAAEMHWSPGTIMAIFFAVTLVSAVFFGLGYSFGRRGAALSRSAVPLSSAETAVNAEQQDSPARQKQVVTGMLLATNSAQGTLPSASQPEKPSSRSAGTEKPSSVIASFSANATLATPAPKQTMVQVGAIGNRRDAQRLVAQLRRHGFHARIYSSSNDHFLHVQIGPFADTEQAELMRHRVQTSGFHAILKHAK